MLAWTAVKVLAMVNWVTFMRNCVVQLDSDQLVINLKTQCKLSNNFKMVYYVIYATRGLSISQNTCLMTWCSFGFVVYFGVIFSIIAVRFYLTQDEIICHYIKALVMLPYSHNVIFSLYPPVTLANLTFTCYLTTRWIDHQFGII